MGKKSDVSEYYEVEEIKGKKKIGGKWMYYVKWENYPDSENTWEPVENLDDCKSMLSEFEREYDIKKNKKLNLRAVTETDFRSQAVLPNLKYTKEVINRPKGTSWFSKAIHDRQFTTSKAKSDFENSKARSLSKSESKMMNYEVLEAPVENINDKDHISQNSFKQLSKLSESLPFNPRVYPNTEKEIVAKPLNINNTDSKTRLTEGMGKIITDPDITEIEVQDHVIIDGDIHFWIVGATTSGEKKSVGYFKNNVVKYNAPIELCNYYEKFIRFYDN